MQASLRFFQFTEMPVHIFVSGNNGKTGAASGAGFVAVTVIFRGGALMSNGSDPRKVIRKSARIRVKLEPTFDRIPLLLCLEADLTAVIVVSSCWNQRQIVPMPILTDPSAAGQFCIGPVFAG